jgi:hypothetical protein
MNNLLKLWTALIKDAGSKYAESHGILSDKHDGFRQHRSIHDALSSIIMMIEDAKLHHKDIYVMYADFKGAFNAADHRIMFKHMRQLGMPPTFVDTCEPLYGVSSTDYITPYSSTPSMDINRGTLQEDTLSPFMFTLLLEPFLRWLTVGSMGYLPGAPTTNADPSEPTATYLGHGFADDFSLATVSPPNMSIQLRKLSLFSAYTCMTVNIQKCCITGALWRSGSALSLANCTLLASRLKTQFITINSRSIPIPSIGPSDTYRVLGVGLNTSLTFNKHLLKLKRATISLITALSKRPYSHNPAGYVSSAAPSSASSSPSSSASSTTPSWTSSKAKSAEHSAPPSPRCEISLAQPSTAQPPTSATASPPSKPTPHNSQYVTSTNS